MVFAVTSHIHGEMKAWDGNGTKRVVSKWHWKLDLYYIATSSLYVTKVASFSYEIKCAIFVEELEGLKNEQKRNEGEVDINY